MKTTLRRIGIILLYLLAAFALLLTFSARWALNTWPDLKMEEIIFELQAPLEGTGNGMIGAYLAAAVVPTVLIFAALIICGVLAARRGIRVFRILLPILSVGLIAFTFFRAWNEMGLGEWIDGQMHASTFIEDNYADPAQTAVTFPKKKKNLICIFLESMETTFADVSNGGAFPYNCIPELTALAEENEDFSGSSEELNGGVALSGATWTMGAMFAATSGLPLKVSMGNNQMVSQQSFFPDIRTLGDILADEGYNQTLLIGSDAAFGGRRLYFEDHGDYAIEDYPYAQKSGRIPSGYKVWWGYEDKRLFEFAKDTLTRMAAEDAPFNLTMLTVDTHFENGYVCELCDDEFDGNQYANVMACSSRQVTEFVEWVKEQDFYEDTAIVITGDHRTMDKDFCDDVPSSYQRRVYTCYLNADAVNEDPERRRVFTTFDTFPTTLAAMGAQIDGDRLGLGTNLFSGRDTLSEEFGLDFEKKEMKRSSAFLQKLEKVDADALLKVAGADVTCPFYDTESKELTVRVRRIRGLTGKFASARAYLTDRDGNVIAEGEATALEADKHCDIALAASPKEALYGGLTVIITGSDGEERTVADDVATPLLRTGTDFAAYLRALAVLRDMGDYSVLMAVKDDASTNFTDEMQSLFDELGLETRMQNAFRCGYIACLMPGSVHEQVGEEAQTYEGALPDGTPFSILSAGFDAGRRASIVIGGNEFSSNERGFNVVVYDNAAGTTLGRSSFDLYQPESYSSSVEIGGRLRILGRIHVRLYDCVSPGKTMYVILSCWYEDNPKDIQMVQLSKGVADDYVGMIKGRAFAKSPLHIETWFVSSMGTWNYGGTTVVEP